ncbi:MAG: hypothetical protein VST68_08050, partial [Nitrospirota bacterium]|nr:hypothetical protein [Nitrospirota bacterium]
MDKTAFLLLIMLSITWGCATLLGASPTITTSCSFEETWSLALASVNEFELRGLDKNQGVIETEWLAFASQRKAGLLQRDANQERARFFINLKSTQGATQVSVRQFREFLSPMGVQSQAVQWRRIPPISGEEQRLVQRISHKLE